MKFAPIEIDMDMDYSTETVLHTRRLTALMCDVKLDTVKDRGSQLWGAIKGVSGWSKDLDKQIMARTRLEMDLVLTFILSYCQRHEVAARVMVKILTTC